MTVITGLGLISPLGASVEKSFDALYAGKGGVRVISLFDASTYPTKIAAEADFVPLIGGRRGRLYSRTTHMAILALEEARLDAKIESFPEDANIVCGSSAESFEFFPDEILKSKSGMTAYEEGADPFLILKSFIGAPAAAIALRTGITGFATTVSAACVSFYTAVGMGSERVSAGLCDICVVGGGDSAVNPMILRYHNAAGVLTERFENPVQAVQPFDRRRDRPVLGEGYGIMILESEERARNRGARIFARITAASQGYENCSPTYSIDETAILWAALMKKISPEVPEVMFCHAPGDRILDEAELRAMSLAWGSAAAKIYIHSGKGAYGSGMASAGAIQVITAVLALYHQKIPSTKNLMEPEIEGYNYVSNSIKHNFKTLYCSGHGVGGVNGGILLEKFK